MVDFSSDMGIDDIQILAGECDAGAVSTTPVPDAEKEWDCSMEAGTTCNWNFDSNWVVGNFFERKFASYFEIERLRRENNDKLERERII